MVRTRSKRDIILEVAQSLFSKNGYEETTIADIAREANIAVGTIYLHYHNKHEIYTAVSLSFKEKLTIALENPFFLELPFRQAIRAIVTVAFKTCHDYTQLLKLKQTDIQSKEEVKQHEQSNERLTKAIENMLKHAIEKGELVPFDTATYAQLINLFGESVLNQCFVMENANREELYLNTTIEFLERVFFGPSLASQVTSS